MAERQRLRLDALATIMTGATPPASQPDSWGDDVDFITPSDQYDGQRTASPSRRLSQIGAERLRKRLVPSQSTNLTCIGSTIGKVTMAAGPSITNQQINTLVAKPGIADPVFLYYMVKNWSGSLKGHASGSATPIVNKSVLSGYEFEVPGLPEQRAIAEVLGALDDKIAANTKLAETADDFLASEFARLVSSSSEMQPLATIADVNKRTVKPVKDGNLRYVDIASVGVGHYDFPELSPWNEAPSRARRGLRKGDTIWSTVRPNRRSHALVLSSDQLLVGSTGLAVLTPRVVGFAYLYEVTKRPEFTTYLETVAEGSAYPAVRADKFLEAPVPILPIEDRDRFESAASALRLHVESLIEENRTLAATRDAMLPQLMSGHLRVRDI